jgi:hypothetical protein
MSTGSTYPLESLLLIITIVATPPTSYCAFCCYCTNHAVPNPPPPPAPLVLCGCFRTQVRVRHCGHRCVSGSGQNGGGYCERCACVLEPCPNGCCWVPVLRAGAAAGGAKRAQQQGHEPCAVHRLFRSRRHLWRLASCLVCAVGFVRRACMEDASPAATCAVRFLRLALSAKNQEAGGRGGSTLLLNNSTCCCCCWCCVSAVCFTGSCTRQAGGCGRQTRRPTPRRTTPR